MNNEGVKNKITSLRETIKIIIYIFVCTLITLTIAILFNNFLNNGINWQEFIEFIAASLILIFILDPGLISIRIPGIVEVERKLKQIDEKIDAFINQQSQKQEQNQKQSTSIEQNFTLGETQKNLAIQDMNTIRELIKEQLKQLNN